MLYTRALYLHLAICAPLSRHFYHLMNQKSLRYPTFGYFEETNLNQLKFNSVKLCFLHNCLLIKCIFMILSFSFNLIFFYLRLFQVRTSVPSACVQVATPLFVSEEELFIQLINIQLQNISLTNNSLKWAFFRTMLAESILI